MHRLQFFTQLFQHPDLYSVLVLTALGVVAVALVYLASRLDVTVILVTALMLEMFSGNWSLMGISIPLDRVVLVVALGALIIKGTGNVGERRIIWRPVHLALLCAAAWCAASGLIAGTITGHLGFYAFLDRFGLVPFALFCLAPVFFGTARQRNILLVGLVFMGLYLGLTGCLEGAHIYKLVFPRYIANPYNGIQFGRARGPILESTGDGFCIFVGAAASVIGLYRWRATWARALCLLAIGADGAAIFFTLTRGVWIGAFVGAVAAMMLTRQTRRILVPLLVAGAVAVAGTLAVSSSIRSEVLGRTTSESPVWDRQNTDLAAVRIIKDLPLTGVGWENFVNVSPNYMVQQATYPITGVGIEVHNVFLSHAAELGIPGLLLWLLAFGGAVRRGLLPGKRYARPRSQGPPDELQLWRAATFAVLLCFLVEADLAPFSQALPNSLLWALLGLCAAPYTSALSARFLHSRPEALDLAAAAPAADGSAGVAPEPQPAYV